GCWYRVRAFGPGGESWGIDERFIAASGDGLHFKTDLEQIYDLAFHKGYAFADGRRLRCRALGVDSGYAARLDEVKALAQRPGVVMTKGMSNMQWSWKRERASPYRMSDNVRDLMLVNVDHYKSKLHRLVRLPEDHQQAYHFHRQTPDWVFLHICNEQQTIQRHKSGKRKGRSVMVWTVRYEGAPNHILDTEVIILAIADHLAVSLLAAETQPIGLIDAQARRPTPTRPRKGAGGLGSSI
ncbi:MAG: terminase gpA endonuclease subunit, partial [Pseudomonadota bacterium]